MKPMTRIPLDKLPEYSSYSARSVASPEQSTQSFMSETLTQLSKAAKEFSTLSIPQRITLAESCLLYTSRCV